MKQLNESTIKMISEELKSIPEKFHKNFNSNHEGFAVLLEEVEELKKEMFWGEKNHTPIILKERIRDEAIQVAAMAVRIIQELT